MANFPTAMNHVISTERLDLVPMTPMFLKLTSLGSREPAEVMLGLKIPLAWFQCGDFAALRLRQFESGSTTQEWLPRAIALRDSGEMVGYIGFHTPPNPDYLKGISPRAVEFGYTIFEEYRRRRFAWEATHGLMRWAHGYHGVIAFVVSISPQNTASSSMASKMGFRRIGSHIDEEDGPEDILELIVDKKQA